MSTLDREPSGFDKEDQCTYLVANYLKIPPDTGADPGFSERGSEYRGDL